MNICIVAKFFYAERIGGAEVQAWLLAKELASRGHSVSYVCESLTGRGGTVENKDGVQVHWLKHLRYFNILSMPAYASALNRIRPDVVLHRYTSGYEWALGRYCRKHNAKFVWICTDNASPVRDYFVAVLRNILNRTARPFYKRWPLFLHAWLKDRSRENGMRFVTHPCVQNEAQRGTFAEHYGRAAFPFPSGHEIPDSLPEKPESPPIVLWVAGFGAGKRPELFAQLAKACAAPDIRFVMISKRFGADTHMKPEEIHHLAGSETAFDWHIDLPLDDTLAWFDQASVFVNTSLPANEGFPNTFVQAWSRGVPVVSFGVNPDGILDTLGLGRCIGTLDEGRDAIRVFLGEPTDARQQRQDYARTHFSIAHVADHLLEILEQTPESLDD